MPPKRRPQEPKSKSRAAANNLGGASQQGGAVSLPARNNSGRAPQLRGTASLPAASSSALTIPTHTSKRGIVKAGSGRGKKNNLIDAVNAIIQSGNEDAIKTNLSLLERSIGNRNREQQLPEYRRNANTKAAQNHERWTNIERTQRNNLQAALDSFSPNLIIRATTTSAAAASSSFQPRAGGGASAQPGRRAVPAAASSSSQSKARGGASAQLPPPPDWSKLNFKKKNQNDGE